MIVVPTSVLAAQWAEEVRDFGVSPIVLSGLSPAARRAALEDAMVALHSSAPRTEVAIATLSLFTRDQALRTFIDEIAPDVKTVLIADEVHNFGAYGFISDPPVSFEHRIGLSATPVRQYDAEGTGELFNFFHTDGEPAFTFTLGDAIKAGCLTPYNYFLHEVELDWDEMHRYSELTEQLVKAGFAADDRAEVGLSDRQESLLRERRSLVEQATGKIVALRNLLAPRVDDISHTLIYCSAKAVVPPHSGKQIDQARGVLRDLRIDTHMYTAAETGRAGSRMFLEGFAIGSYPVLLAMKVLDEGVDVPAARAAYLLASSTVEREWVQRRGRVLRRSPDKEVADLHDFIVLPPSRGATGARGLIQSELRRAQHFANDARNKYDPGGPIDVIRAIEEQL
jgi:superfamily II DNA or RNA helicase